ncbi:MAG: glutamate-1-semialdehyde 2,1-aminomutase [bacterium]
MLSQVTSEQLYEEAIKHYVGGVNSPVRSFKNVEAKPIYFSSGQGPIIYSVEGRKFIDYVLAWGTFILGHSDPDVQKEIIEQLYKGIHFGACSPLEIEYARLIKEGFRTIEKIRVLNSGTEAVMVAIRLARAYTNRRKIVKFSGNYHGHVDYLLVKSGSGLATFSIPSSKGVPQEFIDQTIVVEYNDFDTVEKVFEEHGKDIAAVIVEPVAGNIGVIPPKNGFLQNLRQITKAYESILIFDEVITCFRNEYGGLSNQYDPDLVVLGKIVGGGMPIGVVGGKSYIMDLLAPEGQVYHGGTFCSNPLTLAAGIATLKKLKNQNYGYLEELAHLLQEGIVNIKNRYNLKLNVNRWGSMMSIFFTEHEVNNSQNAYNSDRRMFAEMFRFLVTKGVYLPPSPFEAIFLSFSHTSKEINYTIDKIEEFFMNVSK